VNKRAAIAVLLVLAAPARADDASDMAAAANRFYATYAAQPRHGGLPDGVARGRYLPLLSPRLARLLNDAGAAQVRFHAKVKNAPPLIAGDIFSSQFEGFQTYKVGACSGSATAGRCSVQLHYGDPAPPSGAQKTDQPVDWSDEILLVKAGGAWKVDDIAYKGSFAFGNSGLLSQTLQMVISTAP
jgi:hypothetical protein